MKPNKPTKKEPEIKKPIVKKNTTKEKNDIGYITKDGIIDWDRLKEHISDRQNG